MFGFIKSFIQRYFILDHKSETMQIFEKNEPTSPSKIYHYSEIIDLIDDLGTKVDATIQLRWSFRFILKCKTRDFELYTASEDEKFLWLYAFNDVLTINNRNKVKLQKQQKTADKFKLLDHY